MAIPLTTTGYPAAILNAYTHAPPQHPNLLIGALHLLVWLFYHPSAWRSHIARIALDLRPDFTLVELNRHRWRNRPLVRLLVQGYVILPCLMSALLGLVLWLLAVKIELVVTNVVAVIGACAVFGIAMGVNIGVAASFACLIILGPALVLPEVISALNRTVLVDQALSFFLTIGIASGFVGGLVGSVNRSLRQDHRATPPNLVRQMTGIIASALIGMLLFGLVLSAASFVPDTLVPFPVTFTSSLYSPISSSAAGTPTLGGAAS